MIGIGKLPFSPRPSARQGRPTLPYSRRARAKRRGQPCGIAAPTSQELVLWDPVPLPVARLHARGFWARPVAALVAVLKKIAPARRRGG